MRWRPQFHLSTAWLMMCAAAIIVWLNLRERVVKSEHLYFCFMPETVTKRLPDGTQIEVIAAHRISDFNVDETLGRGFPLPARLVQRRLIHWVDPPADAIRLFDENWPSYYEESERAERFDTLAIVVDVSCAFFVLLAIFAASEFLIRRRSRTMKLEAIKEL